MPRKGQVEHREILPDPIYNSDLVEKFINCMMWDGKKAVSQQIFYKAVEKAAQAANEEPLKVFKKAIENCKPLLEVKTRRVGGANYQVPVEVNANRRTSLAIRWIISFARERGEKGGMIEKLSAELLDAANNRGAAIKKKEDVHRMAEANKAFAHYRW
jgi:small subunit ribosomal protein S7